MTSTVTITHVTALTLQALRLSEMGTMYGSPCQELTALEAGCAKRPVNPFQIGNQSGANSRHLRRAIAFPTLTLLPLRL